MPYDIVSSITVNRFDIDSIDIQLFKSAVIRVNLYGFDGFRVSVRNVVMEGDDYANWGNDDQYIITYVMNKLGFVPTPPLVEEIPVTPLVEEVPVTPLVEEVPVTPLVEEIPVTPLVEEVPVVIEEVPVTPLVEEVPVVIEEVPVTPLVEEVHVVVEEVPTL